MTKATDIRTFAALRRAAVLAIATAGLGGCVYYPSGYGYNTGYYAPAITLAPPPIVVGGWWGGWGHRGWGDDDR
ncbi:MAG: hypothetical protein POH28_14510 [Acidocella sp.]|nr:hypothetical protein [Acidocella sp.]